MLTLTLRPDLVALSRRLPLAGCHRHHADGEHAMDELSRDRCREATPTGTSGGRDAGGLFTLQPAPLAGAQAMIVDPDSEAPAFEASRPLFEHVRSRLDGEDQIRDSWAEYVRSGGRTRWLYRHLAQQGQVSPTDSMTVAGMYAVIYVPPHASVLAEVLAHGRLLRRPAGTTIIDVGCGPATLALAVGVLQRLSGSSQASSWHYVGIDHNPSMLQLAREVLESANVFGSFELHEQVGTVDVPCSADGPVIVMSQLLSERALARDQQALASLARGLMPLARSGRARLLALEPHRVQGARAQQLGEGARPSRGRRVRA